MALAYLSGKRMVVYPCMSRDTISRGKALPDDERGGHKAGEHEGHMGPMVGEHEGRTCPPGLVSMHAPRGLGLVGSTQV